MRFAPAVTVSGALKSVMLGPAEIGEWGVGRRNRRRDREEGWGGGMGEEEDKELYFYIWQNLLVFWFLGNKQFSSMYIWS